MTTTAHVPQLRFPEFSGEWDYKQLSDVCSMKAGKFVAANQISEIYRNGLYPCFGGNGLRGFTESFTHNGLFPLIGRQGAHCGNVQLADGQFHATEHAVVVNADNNYNKMWLFYQLKRANLNQYATGQAQPGLSVDVINKVLITITSLPEQTKIAAFLSAVDTKIDQLTQKKALLETYKKGVMQQIFSQKIRFTPDEGGEYPEWEEKRLGEVLDYLQPTPYLVASTEYDDSYDTPVLTAGKTFILGYTNEIEGIFSKNLPVIIFDDFTTDSKYVDFEFKAKSSAMKILVGKSDISVKFVFEAMQQIKYEVGGHGRHWISVFSQMMMLFPCPEEQTKIANFLSAIDRKIDLVSQQLEQAKAFKKGLLQQMFV